MEYKAMDPTVAQTPPKDLLGATPPSAPEGQTPTSANSMVD